MTENSGTWAWVIDCWGKDKKLKFRRLEFQEIFLYIYLGKDDEVLCKYPDIPKYKYIDRVSLYLTDFNATDWVIVND